MRGLYVNGLNTSKDEAICDARALSSKLNSEVVLEYNPKSNLLFDLSEAVWGRWLGRYIPSKFVRNLKHSITQLLMLSEHPVVMIMAHSQGCLHAMNAVNLLSKEQKQHIYLILFAAPTIYETKDLFKVEYFYNDEDWVVSDLVRDWKKDDKKVFKRPSRLHNFIHGYLNAVGFFRRSTDNKTSLFAHMVEVGEKENSEDAS